MKKLSSELYKAQRQLNKFNRVSQNIEDLSNGKVDKVIKREVRHSIRKEANKNLNKFFKRIGF